MNNVLLRKKPDKMNRENAIKIKLASHGIFYTFVGISFTRKEYICVGFLAQVVP